MQPHYQFTITDTKYDSYKKIASLLFLIAGLLFFLKGFRMVTFFDKIILLGASFILIGYSVYTWLYKKRQEKSYFFIYSLIAVVWILETPYWYISLVYVILMIFHYIMEREFIISITGQHIELRGFLKKSYAWNDFNNVVLKGGLLTLDFKNNKVLQVEPDWEKFPDQMRDYDAFQRGFSEFCSLHLKS